MKPVAIVWLAGVIAVMAALPFDASAQMFNRPFSFKYHGGAGDSVGMSTAYKQVILERELSGRSADNPLVRDYSGALLDVERGNSGQAFVRAQASPFQVGTIGSGLGFGMSSAYGGTGTSGVLFGGGTDRVMAGWISSLMGGDGYRGVAPAVVPYSSASIDLWISQLQTL